MAKKDRKKINRKTAVTLCLVSLVLGLGIGAGGVYILLKDGIVIEQECPPCDNTCPPCDSTNPDIPAPLEGIQEGVVYDDFQVHFLELGNKLTGDSIYIKAGDNDILIDAGSRQYSAPTLEAYLDQYVTDNKLEYVIATHADTDHISAFSGEDGIFSHYKVDTIIDFARTNKTTKTYKDYVAKRDYLVSQGTKHYTALDCWNETNGAKRTYTLGENITMDILYQRFYEEDTGDENDYSVCTLFTAGEHKFLLTGDLEKAGEASLVEHNKDKIKDCTLFKAGHHGSKTSNTPALLNVVKPQISVAMCVAGSDQYTNNPQNQFPTQAYINNISEYTDRVYIPTMTSTNAEGYESMNGNIIVSTDLVNVGLHCDNNYTKLKDSNWFKTSRECPFAWR